MTISIVGSGNMAYQLTGAFVKANYDVKGIYSRNLTTAHEIGQQYDIPVFTDFSSLLSDVVFLCVSDDAIYDVSSVCASSERILVHTSGSTSTDVINNERKGVFYPLQTMTKLNEVDFGKVPIFVTSDQSDITSLLLKIAKSISGKAYVINDDQRLKLHLSAVITNNFMNHLAVKAKALLEGNGLDYAMITPLLEMTFDKIAKQPYNMTQTGPAIRGDKKVLEKHMQLLANDPNLKEIYDTMSKSIYDFESKN
jgi:predicted short-subunit dehydrogenase-like oxidoreductase (DUF2520 family)